MPPGFAHGFYVISREAEFVYKCTDYYAPEHERCIRWDDSDLDIAWPVPNGIKPELSEMDEQGMAFRAAEVFE